MSLESQETSADRDIGDVGGPYLVRPIDRHAAQQIGIHFVAWRRLGRTRFGSQRRDSHLPHQPLHALAIDRMSVLPQHSSEPPRAQEWPAREQLVDPPHQAQIIVVGRPPFAVDARAGDSQKLALPPHRQIIMVAVEQELGGPARSSSGPPR